MTTLSVYLRLVAPSRGAKHILESSCAILTYSTCAHDSFERPVFIYILTLIKYRS